MSGNELETRAAERFFERQRREIMGRIAEHEARRRTRRTALPLAAALLIGALLSVAVLFHGPAARPDVAGGEWVFAWSLPAEMTGSDALDAYGSPAGSGDAAEGSAAMAVVDEADFAGPDLLPPLFDEIEDLGDASASADRG